MAQNVEHHHYDDPNFVDSILAQLDQDEQRRNYKIARTRDKKWKQRLDDVMAGRSSNRTKSQTSCSSRTRTASKNDAPTFVGAHAGEYAKALNVDKMLRHAEERNYRNPTLRHVLRIDDDIEWNMIVREQGSIVEDVTVALVDASVRLKHDRIRKEDEATGLEGTKLGNFFASAMGGKGGLSKRAQSEGRHTLLPSALGSHAGSERTMRRGAGSKLAEDAQRPSLRGAGSKLAEDSHRQESSSTLEEEEARPEVPLQELVAKWDRWLGKQMDATPSLPSVYKR